MYLICKKNLFDDDILFHKGKKYYYNDLGDRIYEIFNYDDEPYYVRLNKDNYVINKEYYTYCWDFFEKIIDIRKRKIRKIDG